MECIAHGRPKSFIHSLSFLVAMIYRPLGHQLKISAPALADVDTVAAFLLFSFWFLPTLHLASTPTLLVGGGGGGGEAQGRLPPAW
jgi:hypothetical protein